jgi:hypothetical protein
MGGMKRWAGIALVALILTTSVQAAVTPQSPVDFVRQEVAWVASAQFGKLYQTLHPAQQQAISYTTWHRCTIAGLAVARRLGMDFRTLKFVSAKIEPHRKTITVPGTHGHVLVTAIDTTISLLIHGKRRTLGPNDPGSTPDYLVNIDGNWRWIDTNLPDYKKPNCGNG